MSELQPPDDHNLLSVVLNVSVANMASDLHVYFAQNIHQLKVVRVQVLQNEKKKKNSKLYIAQYSVRSACFVRLLVRVQLTKPAVFTFTSMLV